MHYRCVPNNVFLIKICNFSKKITVTNPEVTVNVILEQQIHRFFDFLNVAFKKLLFPSSKKRFNRKIEQITEKSRNKVIFDIALDNITG